MISEFNGVNGLLGGILIGLSATLLLLGDGRIAGISGIINGAISFKSSERWRWTFLFGLLMGAVLYEYALAPQPTPTSNFVPLANGRGWFSRGLWDPHGKWLYQRSRGLWLGSIVWAIASGSTHVFCPPE